MESLFGIISISLLFLVLLAVIYFLTKKKYFSSKSYNVKLESGNTNTGNLDRLDKLRKENDGLNKEIKFLEEKNRRLRIKIDQMKRVISTLEQQKAQLEKSEKNLKKLRVQKDETLAIVAHDLKNPASTIKNFVELLESYDLSAQEQHDVLSGLVETSSRLLKLADEFTSVITEEYVPFNISITENNLKESVERIVKVNRVKAREKDIEIRLYQPELELELNFDEDKIKEVLDNFIGNAIKYCPEKSKNDVITKIVNKDVIVEVTDNGFGLTEDEVSHAFEKGSKLSTKPTGNETSSGLGLWIAKKIVEEHKGRVYLKSKKGFGATFSFTLPIN